MQRFAVIVVLVSLLSLTTAFSATSRDTNGVAAKAETTESGGVRKKSKEDDEAEKQAQRDRQAAIPFLRARLEAAHEHYDQGHYLVAYRLADAILTVMPDVPFAKEARALRRNAEARHYGSTVLSVRYEPKEDAAFPISTLAGAVVVENISKQPVSIEVPESTALAYCEYRLFEVYPDGSQWSTRGTKVVHADGAFRLAPGERREELLAIEVARSPRLPILQLFEVHGSFRPKSIVNGDEAINRRIPWQKSQFITIDAELRDVRNGAFESLHKALDDDDTLRVIAAGYCWLVELEERGELAGDDYEATIDLLIAKLAAPDAPVTGATFERVIMRLLETLTGTSRRPDKETWIRWAKGRTRREVQPRH